MRPGDHWQQLPGFSDASAAVESLLADPAPCVHPEVADEPAHEPGLRPAQEPDIVVVRSARRKRTVGAQLRAGTLTVTVPSWMSAADELHWVEVMRARFARKASADRVDLAARALALSRRFELPRVQHIRWVDDMTSRWGSCTPATSTIRISNRLAGYPDWVLDYVIVHELAHLDEANHSPAFWRLVERYPKAERARGYLIAKSGDDSDAD